MLQRVNELFKPNNDGISRYVSREEILQTELGKNWGNGVMRYNVAFNTSKYLWEAKRFNDNPRGKIIGLRTIGLSEDESNERPISELIRKELLKENACCVVCGSRNNVIIDHKNHMYNDFRVLKKETQQIDDFQVLCNHCNLQKRQTSVDERNEMKRYSALNIPSIAIFGIDYIEGTEKIDLKDPNTMKGTYWYDPVIFLKECKRRMSDLNN
jgi:hypothetical protein